MADISYRFQVSTGGMNAEEVCELTEFLRSTEQVKSVERATRYIAAIEESAVVGWVIPEFHLHVQMIVHSIASVAHSEITKDVAEDVVKVLTLAISNWLQTRFSNKTDDSIDVTIYGPDNKPIAVVKRKR